MVASAARRPGTSAGDLVAKKVRGNPLLLGSAGFLAVSCRLAVPGSGPEDFRGWRPLDGDVDAGRPPTLHRAGERRLQRGRAVGIEPLCPQRLRDLLVPRRQELAA